jgi:hypothetical protein
MADGDADEGSAKDTETMKNTARLRPMMRMDTGHFLKKFQQFMGSKQDSKALFSKHMQFTCQKNAHNN